MSATTSSEAGDRPARPRSTVAASLAVLVALAGLTGWTLTRSAALDEARAAYGRSDLTTALRRALDHLDRRPWSTEARRIAGLSLVRLDRPGLAGPYLDLGGRFDRDDALLLARGLERAGLAGQAADVYRLVLDRLPDDPVGLERLAILRGEAGRPRESIALADRLARVPAKAATAEAIRAAALLRLGEVAGASAAFEAAARLDPALKSIAIPAATFWADGVEAMLQAGRGAEARRLLEARLAERGEDAILLDRLAAIARREGREADAGSLWRRSIAADPTLAGPWLELGRIALGRGRPLEAIPFLDRAAALGPDDPEPREALGRAYQLLGRAEESRRQLRRADTIRSRASRPGDGRKIP